MSTGTVHKVFADAADVVRVVAQRAEDLLFRARVEEHMYGGHRLMVSIADRAAADRYGADMPRPPAFDLLKDHGLGEGRLVFDIGAHQGVFAMALAREVGPAGHVVAVEPRARNAEIARANAVLNGLRNIEVTQAAAARANGPILVGPGRSSAIALKAGAGVEQAEGVTIDALAARHGPPDVIFLDLEGYEVEALKGASGTIAGAASWCVEVHGDTKIGQFGGRNADVPRLFGERFDLYWSPDNRRVAFRPMAHGAAAPIDRFYLIAIPRP